jgi:hypothetical protein
MMKLKHRAYAAIFALAGNLLSDLMQADSGFLVTFRFSLSPKLYALRRRLLWLLQSAAVVQANIHAPLTVRALKMPVTVEVGPLSRQPVPTYRRH